jgi:Ca2+-binding EF-hand superfamily protein
MAPPDTSTYRPALILLAGFAATLAALCLHRRYLNPAAPASDTGLHRSNAVRRPHTRRRRHANESGSSNSSGSAPVGELAISHLLAREASGAEYGTFAPSVTVDTLLVEELPEFRLLPSQLPSVNDLLSLASMPETAARATQRRIHSVFMHSFLEQEYSNGHLIQGDEAAYLREQLTNLNIDSTVVEACIANFNTERLAGMPTADLIAGTTPRINLAATQGLQRLTEPLVFADGVNDTRRDADTQALDTRETVADDQSHASHHSGSGSETWQEEGQDVMSLVYRVAEDNSRKINYVHRGVMCNGCRVQPIQGIRYSCANCPDYDLCEDCEANQIHIKTHIFYKVRIPAPLLGYHRPTAPTWYPGKPHLLTEELRERFPNALKQELAQQYNMESEELQALWEQFICLASCSWPSDPLRLGVAIDRDGFDKCFCPPTSLRSPPPNLIYDRLFAFYDTNDDGKIGFEEFLKGLVNLKDNSRHAKLRRIFEAYDLDNDGFVCRKDFLRLFRAYYSYSKEMAMASVAAFDENQNDPYARDVDRDEVRRKVEGGRPISAIFDGSIPAGHSSRGLVGQSLSPDAHGDLTITDNNGVLEDSDEVGNHNDAIGDAARPLNISFRTFRPPSDADGATQHLLVITHPDDADITPSGSDAVMGHMYGWPPINDILPEDIFNALGRHVPVEEVMDPVDRARIFYAQSQRLDAEGDQTNETIRRTAMHERWKKRKFFTDEEEGATAPPGYTEADSSDDEADHKNGAESPDSISDSRRQSLRSRSSSKVRFEDDVTETDYETRSNTSSRSIPVGERWGGYEIRDVEKDVGKEVLYQAIQQGFNELLDPLFKEKEDLAIAAASTRALRRKWAENTSEKIQPEHLEMLLDRSKEALYEQRQMDWDGPIPLPSENVSPSVPSSSSRLDPTMPQNRPDQPLLASGDRSIPFPRELVTPTVRSSSPDPDPTMPQNRPDSLPLSDGDTAVDSTAVSQTTSRTARLAALNEMDPQTAPQKSSVPLSQRLHSPLPPITEPGPSVEALNVWVKHNEVDAEAKKRGGYGKLDFDEFSRRMVKEDLTDSRFDRDENKIQEEGKWGNSAGLGRLWFVGTWIEQAAF